MITFRNGLTKQTNLILAALTLGAVSGAAHLAANGKQGVPIRAPQIAASPLLPNVPRLDVTRYPSCQNSWQQGTSRYVRFQLVQQCINLLEQYNIFYLQRFPAQLRAYADTLQQIGTAFRQTNAPLVAKQRLIADIRERIQRVRSIDSSHSWGDDYNDYYLYVRRYKDDVNALTAARAHLQDRGI